LESDDGTIGKKEFFLEEKHITIEHKLDHQYEGIVVRVIGVEVFHPIRAPYKGFWR
jgi:hypothetical protein